MGSGLARDRSPGGGAEGEAGGAGEGSRWPSEHTAASNDGDVHFHNSYLSTGDIHKKVISPHPPPARPRLHTHLVCLPQPLLLLLLLLVSELPLISRDPATLSPLQLLWSLDYLWSVAVKCMLLSILLLLCFLCTPMFDTL